MIRILGFGLVLFLFMLMLHSSLRSSAPSAVIFFTAKCAEKYPQSYAEILSLSITTGMAYGYGLLNLTTLTFETASFFYA